MRQGRGHRWEIWSAPSRPEPSGHLQAINSRDRRLLAGKATRDPAGRPETKQQGGDGQRDLGRNMALYWLLDSPYLLVSVKMVRLALQEP